MPKIPQQVLPIVLVFSLLVAALLVGRAVLLPKTFGDIGHYRADALGELAALPQSYAGGQVCGDCHVDEWGAKLASHHASVACESCHGPAFAHTESPDETKPKVNSGRDGCTICHGYNVSRPSGFPQIQADFHNPGQKCVACHSAHAPELPTAPGDCAACHRQIANQKRVSRHAMLGCETCHPVPAEHNVTPRLAKAQRPTTQAVCLNCHAGTAALPLEAPQIDASTHGGRYLCWECHYPHDPEATR